MNCEGLMVFGFVRNTRKFRRSSWAWPKCRIAGRRE